MHQWKVGDLARYKGPKNVYQIEEGGGKGKKLAIGSEHIVTEIDTHYDVDLFNQPSSIWLGLVGFQSLANAHWFEPVTKLFDEPKMRVKELT